MRIRVGNAQADAEQSSKISWVSPGYFHALGVPVLSGRDIARSDTTTGRKVMLVNQTFVRRYLADNHVYVDDGLSRGELARTLGLWLAPASRMIGPPSHVVDPWVCVAPCCLARKYSVVNGVPSSSTLNPCC